MTTDGYDLTICACKDGPYLGARKAGAPCCCERCGRMTREQYDALAAPLWDEGYRHGAAEFEVMAGINDNPYRTDTP